MADSIVVVGPRVGLAAVAVASVEWLTSTAMEDCRMMRLNFLQGKVLVGMEMEMMPVVALSVEYLELQVTWWRKGETGSV